MLRVWGRANSSNVKKVLWCLEEAGVDYERIDIGGAFGRLDSPQFMGMNPNRQIPVLEDDGLVLWESNPIVRYIGAAYTPGGLYATDPKARAKADKWMDWCSINLAPHYSTALWTLIRTPPDKRDLTALTAAVDAGNKLLGIADAALADQPFLSGETLGLGDVPLGVLADGWLTMPIERPAFVHLTAWHDRLLSRPAYRKIVAHPLS
jgi:glutathione S-transferase